MVAPFSGNLFNNVIITPHKGENIFYSYWPSKKISIFLSQELLEDEFLVFQCSKTNSILGLFMTGVTSSLS